MKKLNTSAPWAARSSPDPAKARAIRAFPELRFPRFPHSYQHSIRVFSKFYHSEKGGTISTVPPFSLYPRRREAKPTAL